MAVQTLPPTSQTCHDEGDGFGSYAGGLSVGAARVRNAEGGGGGNASGGAGKRVAQLRGDVKSGLCRSSVGHAPEIVDAVFARFGLGIPDPVPEPETADRGSEY